MGVLPRQYLCDGKSGSRWAESLRRSCNGIKGYRGGIKGKQRDKKEECRRQLKKVAAPAVAPSVKGACAQKKQDGFLRPAFGSSAWVMLRLLPSEAPLGAVAVLRVAFPFRVVRPPLLRFPASPVPARAGRLSFPRYVGVASRTPRYARS